MAFPAQCVGLGPLLGWMGEGAWGSQERWGLRAVSFWEDIICRAHRGEGEFEAQRSVSWGTLVPSDTPSP